MQRITATLTLALLTVSGCGSLSVDPVGGSTGSEIAPGAYSGTLTTTTTATFDGAQPPTTNSGILTVVFGASGLPVEDGREVFVGQIKTQTAGGFDLSTQVTSIFAAGATVIVNYDVTMQIGDDILLTGTERDVYTLSGRSVTLSWNITVADEFLEILLKIETDGIVVQD